MRYRRLLLSVRRRPDVYFGAGQLSYERLTAFVLGLDIGADGAALDGFREFLAARCGCVAGSPAPGWSGLALWLTLGDDVPPPSGSAADRRAVDGLFDLLEEFFVHTGRDERTRPCSPVRRLRPPKHIRH